MSEFVNFDYFLLLRLVAAVVLGGIIGLERGGITTAAGLWTTACVGLVVGSGYYIMAVCIVALMIFAMFAMRPLARKMRSGTLGLQIGVEGIKSVKLILEQLSEENVEVKSFKIDEENEKEHVELLLRLPRKNAEAELVNKLSVVPGVRELKILS